MTPAERGRRIKEARIAKKMTQSEVVGDFITRNMLSRIESGNATPSVKTLEYLAETLDIPIASLMPQGEEERSLSESMSCAERLLRAKSLFLEGQYEAAAELMECEEEWGAFSDEFAILSAKCFYCLAETCAESDTVRAVELAKRSAEMSERGFYANPALKTEALKLLNSLAERLSKYYAGLISNV